MTIDNSQSLTFELTGIQIGPHSLLPAQPELAVSGNWALYHLPGQPWQMLYEVGDETVEQYFIFDQGLPAEGDLVIEGRFQTTLQPVYLSDEEGIRFVTPAQAEAKAEAEGLGYGPALVIDAAGQQLLARMELNDKQLKLTIPATWLAEAEFPVVVDPVIGPAELISGAQGAAVQPSVAYNPDDDQFLAAWEWNGDLYGQRLDSSGNLTGTLMTISQAPGTQHKADVTYNPVSDEYLVAWVDRRYGSPYYSVYAQRLNRDGTLEGDEIFVMSPSDNLGIYGGVKTAISDAGETLVVWSHNLGGSRDYDLFGQMIEPDGDLSGDVISISIADDNQRDPDVAYDSSDDIFAVVWTDDRNGTFELYGQKLDDGGSPVGGNQLLVDSDKDLDNPAIAATNAGQFLAAWHK